MTSIYTQALRFEPVTEASTKPGAADALLDLNGTQLRTAELRLGGERITLTEHRLKPGRPIPPDSKSLDHWFQQSATVAVGFARRGEPGGRPKRRGPGP